MSADTAGAVNPQKHLRSTRTTIALTIQSRILTAARAYLSDQGYIELLPPIIGPVTDPGARGAKQVDIDYYGNRYKLMTSAILYKQASLLAFEKLFYIAPNIRMEPLDTAPSGRHLTEFHQIDVEAAGASREEMIRLAEGLVRHVVFEVCADSHEELVLLGRAPSSLEETVSRAFGRLTHTAAHERLHDLGHDQDGGAEIDWAGEVLLSRDFTTPFFVVDYPKGSRGFYDRERADVPGVLENFDLLLPDGYGELCSGSRREARYATIVTRIRETGENPAKYDWYLNLLRDGLPESSGFGIGLERFTRFVCGLDSVAHASAFPKFAGVRSP
ncbi:asparagine synthetase A [Streptomyces sp. enrichment culture]|uniref:asparagine synthetase A n=1 Tax=Streptomyces sp. enrichment culture TaxID=1795815 RepID=UPI003F575CD5